MQDGSDAYTGRLGGAAYLPRPLDMGVVYASKSFRMQPPDNRLLWLGWIYEVRQAYGGGDIGFDPK
jgi:hypothetical protein